MIQETHYSVKTDKIITTKTIALVADLHSKPYGKIIDLLKSNCPNMIAIVGDVINHDDDLYPLELFHQCATIAPTFFSLGNHERKITKEQIHEISSTGAVVLDNNWVKVEGFVVGGMTSAFVTEWRKTHKAILKYALPEVIWLNDFEKQAGYRILLDHHPENYKRVTKNRDIDLILSGHAHGGQIRILNQGVYAPHQGFFPQYTSGVYDNRLIVSRGLSNIKLIPRLWNSTEIVFVTINN